MKKVLAGFAAIATMLVLASAAGAAPIVVDSTSDAGGLGAPCTLREAIASSNADDNGGNGCVAGAGSDTITFAVATPATITLGGTQLPAISEPLPDQLTITGPGPTPGALTVSGNNASRVFEVSAGAALTITGLTITAGRTEGADGPTPGDDGDVALGGGLYSEGVLALQDAVVTGNTVVGGDGAAGSSPVVPGPGGNAGDGGIGRGGGIYSESDLSLTATTVSANHALGGSGGAGGAGAAAGGDGGSGGGGGLGLGGGVANVGGTVTAEDSTLSANEALAGAGGAGGNGAIGETRGSGGNGTEGSGGGIHSTAGTTFQVSNSTLTGNEATGSSGGPAGGGAGTGGAAGEPERGFGGGILSESAGVSLDTSTVSGNTADSTGGAGGQGGGVWVSGVSNVLQSTLVDNTAGLGANLVPFAATMLRATIVANPTSQAAGNCFNAGFITSAGFNLEDAATCNLGPPGPATDLENTEPLLGALADYGGPTMTHLPTIASPAVDAVTIGCPPPTEDQRGETRAAPCDIGAVERQPGDPNPPVFPPPGSGPGPGPGPTPTTPATTQAGGPTGQRAAALKKCKKKKKKARKKCKKKAKKLPV